MKWFGKCMMALVLGIAAVAVAQDGATPPVQDDAILLVVPRRYNVVQVAFDVARRCNTVLVSYQGTDPMPHLHVWNGFEWMELPLDDFRTGAFLQAWPGRAMLVGGDDLLPAAVRDGCTWIPKVDRIEELETAPLINAIGQIVPFTASDWRWFAGRYNLSLVDKNAAAEEAAKRESWYDKSAPIDDPEPGFFKYFTRSRRQPRGDAPANEPERIQPVEILPGEEGEEFH